MRLPLLAFSFLLSFSGVLAQKPDTKDWLSFTDSAGMYTALYPASWKNKIKEGNRVFFTSPGDNEADAFFENVNISVKTHPSFGTSVKIGEMFPSVTDQIKSSLRDFKSESQRNFSWNNTDAVEIIYSGYTAQDESPKIRIIQWFCFYKTRLYTVTFTADAGDMVHRLTALAIMGSIRFR